MKRLHVSFTVQDLDKSIQFYSHLFGEQPTVKHDDYAKWMLEDPRVNFVVETAGGQAGFTHAGIQVESDEELTDVLTKMETAEAPYLPEGETVCCYHKSKKGWTSDPDGVQWEAFYTYHETEERGSLSINPESKKPEPVTSGRCC
ncbi:MAG: VOC family protein [Chloroflexota bacterium]